MIVHELLRLLAGDYYRKSKVKVIEIETLSRSGYIHTLVSKYMYTRRNYGGGTNGGHNILLVSK